VRTAATAFSFDAATNALTVTSTQAQYADLAESYSSDAEYTPGTVVVFGGSEEITVSTVVSDPRIAGVVSTEPAHLMNAFQIGRHVLNIALVGRVPCRVVGTISKGDRLVASTIPGVATKLDPNLYQPGCVIGKSLQDFDSQTPDVIEIAVGRA
jgi:hypothetical protein